MKICYNKELEVRYSTDVLVVGGGPAGFAAAVSCARNGIKVMLIEQSGSLGGSSMISMVPELMNFDDGQNFLCGGIGKEIFDSLFEKCSYSREWYNIKSEHLKRIYDDIIVNTDVKTLFYTKLTDVIVDDKKVKYAVISAPDGIWAIEADMYIDCTGNGSLCAMAGASFDYGDSDGHTMGATICTLWGGIDFSVKGQDDIQYAQAYSDGVFSQYDAVLPGIKANFPEIGVGGGNVGHCFNTKDTDVESLTKAMFYGRQVLSEYERYYRNYVPGCEHAEIIRSADYIGIRESRRIHCEQTLTADSFFSQDSFPDEIGRYSYPVDIHPLTADKKGMDDFSKSVSLHHKIGKSYSIPYGCLVPKGLSNVLISGKCIGADRAMQASTRVIPCCYITGQAAGVAAAVCIKSGTATAQADVEMIRRILKENGAYILN